MPEPTSPKITAVLGPTNTGKTHLAIERMCGHSSGAIGFPLRLLAREVYDRVRAIKGDSQVALVTGEERIVPDKARWFLATMESMPLHRDLAFMAVDEAQLGATPERGHIFTDRMLHARGREETMILGADTLRPMVEALVPDAETVSRPRFSTLSYAGPKKLSRLPARSAIVAFSVEEVYAVAEMLRRFRGGAAVVMGALSPHTRNKQVEMFQSGEVDYLVATDAIGMGLNMDVNHIAFASLRKFDGKRQRRLNVAEMAQIAGRAGRHQRDGTFGTLTSDNAHTEFRPEEIEAIEDHRFPPISKLYWRESNPRFDSVETLLKDLERRPQDPALKPAPEAIDLAVLKRLTADKGIAADIMHPSQVQRFWAACSLPDFRKVGADHHARFVAQLWQDLSRGNGHLPQGFLARKISELDNVQGDVDVLAGRIAAIRTWAYIAQRPDWLADPEEMAQRARGVEQKLSDALHQGLAQRFVDRRTAILMKQLGKDAALLPVTLSETNQVAVDGEEIGTLNGFEFVVDASARLADRKILLAAAEKYLGKVLSARAKELCGDDADVFEITQHPESGVVVMWRGVTIGKLTKGADILQPKFVPDRSLSLLHDKARAAVLSHVAAIIARKSAGSLAPLNRLAAKSRSEDCPANLRALYIQLVEGGGIISRHAANPLLQTMAAQERQGLRKSGISVGSFSVFMPSMLKPGAQHFFGLLKSAFVNQDGSAFALPPNFPPVTKIGKDAAVPPAYLRFGTQIVRVDMAEKIIRDAHHLRGGERSFTLKDDLAVSAGLNPGNFHRMLRDAGFRKWHAKAPQETPADGSEHAGGEAAQLWTWRGMAPSSAGKQSGRSKKPQRGQPRAPVAPDPNNPFAVLQDMKVAALAKQPSPPKPGNSPGKIAAPKQLRIDVLLWRLRFCKSRTLARKLVEEKHIRINAKRVTKAHQKVHVGDQITLSLGEKVRAIRMTELPARRGNAAEAARHYDDLPG